MAWTVACEAADLKYRLVGPGTWHTEQQITSGPLNINVLRVDISNPRTTIEAEPGQGRMFQGETVPAAVKREAEPGKTAILGGVNGDFWSMTPKPYWSGGPLVSDGWIHRLGPGKRSVFAVTRDEQVYIGPVTFTIHLLAGKQKIRVESVNLPSSRTVVLFTPPYGGELPASKSARYLLKLDRPELLPNRLVQAIVVPLDNSQSIPMPQNGLVLSVPEASQWRSLLESTRELTIDARMEELSGVVSSCLGGGPRILSQGEIAINAGKEGVGKSFVTAKHPRTAAGVSRDGRTVYLVTVDGRQPKLSVGMDLYELARYMQSLGCWDALNLDGGGSTTMVVDGQVVSRPSDFRGARPVANSLLVVASPGSGRISALQLHPSGEPLVVPAGTQVQLQVRAFDELMAPLYFPSQSNLKADVTGGFSVVSTASDRVTVQVPDNSSEGKLTVSFGEARAEMIIRATRLDHVIIQPSVLLLDPGERVELAIDAKSGKDPVLIQPEMIQTKTADEVVSVTRNQVEALKTGESLLHLRLGNAIEAVPCYVGEAQSIPVESFDSLREMSQLAVSNMRTEATELLAEKEQKKEGTGAARLNYAMVTGGQSRAVLPIEKTISGKPIKLAVWVYGDGKEAWLRSTLVDSKGTTFTADFTDGGKGITWDQEWRRATCWLHDFTPHDFSTGETPEFPVALQDLYLQQDQEALKTSGTIVLDALDALYPPVPQN